MKPPRLSICRRIASRFRSGEGLRPSHTPPRSLGRFAPSGLGRRELLGGALGAAALAACGRDPAPIPEPVAVPEGPARWEPARTTALVVGLLRWADSSTWSNLPRASRGDADLDAALGARGVPAARRRFLRDEAGTRAEALSALDAAIAQVGPGDTLLFYWAGHGTRVESGRAYFAPYDASDDLVATGIAFDEVLTRIERGLRGERALLFADCCYSGVLTELATRSRAIRVASLASSSASEISTRRWTFTDALISGFGGAGNVDVDRDGQVTFADLSRFAIEQMAFAEGQLASAGASPAFPPSFVLGPAAPLPHPRFGERVEFQLRRRWWPATIVGAEGAQLRLHYDGWTESWDELVDPSQLRPYRPETLAAGTRVEVRWRRRWFAATVTEAHLGVHRIHYDDFDAGWDEWVARDRIRSPAAR